MNKELIQKRIINFLWFILVSVFITTIVLTYVSRPPPNFNCGFWCKEADDALFIFAVLFISGMVLLTKIILLFVNFIKKLYGISPSKLPGSNLIEGILLLATLTAVVYLVVLYYCWVVSAIQCINVGSKGLDQALIALYVIPFIFVIGMTLLTKLILTVLNIVRNKYGSSSTKLPGSNPFWGIVLLALGAIAIVAVLYYSLVLPYK